MIMPTLTTICELWCCSFFFFNDTATTEIYTLSLHDALPIWLQLQLLTYLAVLRHWPEPKKVFGVSRLIPAGGFYVNLQGRFNREKNRDAALGEIRSGEHTSELQSPCNLVCRLLLDKNKHATL